MRKAKRHELLLAMARAIAGEDRQFAKPRGPGKGDRHTTRFMERLREEAEKKFGSGCTEVGICGDSNAARADFYFEEEGTIVEVALSLKNSPSEYEKDIFKAVLAKTGSERKKVERVVFFAKTGGRAACEQPLRKAIAAWVKREHLIEVLVYDL